jgi:hypothetical protein
MNHLQQIIELYKDESFKQEFINNYERAGESRYVAENQYVVVFQAITSNECNGISPEPAMYYTSVDSIRRVLLTISDQGLMLDPKKKEIALTTIPSVNANGRPHLDFLLCYRGMYKLIGLSKKVLSSSLEIIYEGDTFEWRGEAEMPKYVMDLGHNKENILAGYCVFKMANGTILAHLVNQEEIYEIINRSIEATSQAGGNSEMWTGPWRSRSIRSKVFRSAFSIHRASLLDNREMINSMTDEDVTPSIDEFAKILEQSLNEQGS